MISPEYREEYKQLHAQKGKLHAKIWQAIKENEAIVREARDELAMCERRQRTLEYLSKIEGA